MRRHSLWILIRAIAIALLVVFAAACEEEFDPASRITSQRFLGVVADPLEATFGETITFRALVTESDGSLYDGPIAWAVVGGDELRMEGQGPDDPADLFLEMPSGPPFTWTVPPTEQFQELYGPLGQNGLLLTVGATAFKGGDLNSEPIAAFKLFVVSGRSADQRMVNPAIDRMRVIEPTGNEVMPNAKGQYVTDSGRVTLRAIPDQYNDRLTYHWFSSEKDFEPDLEDTQKFSPGSTGSFDVFCVLRKSFFFEHDDGSQTRLTGMDWEHVRLKIQ